jgi:hypothetical protein
MVTVLITAPVSGGQGFYFFYLSAYCVHVSGFNSIRRINIRFYS